MTDLARLLDERLAAGRIELPIFSSSAAEIMGLGSADSIDMRRLTDIVRRDPTLVAHILKMANSPAFAPTSPVVSLPQAVTRLGTRRVCEMSLVVVCRTRAFKLKGHAGSEKKMLKHAIATATFAQEIARLRRLNVEEAFLLGLMHDVGEPAVLQLASDIVKEKKIAVTEAMYEAEVARLHEGVGATIARRWNLPERVAAAIASHHGECTPQSALLVLADALAHHLLDSTPEPKDVAALHGLPAAGVLNLYPEDLDGLFARRSLVMTALEALS